jgi:hypothetical protein
LVQVNWFIYIRINWEYLEKCWGKDIKVGVEKKISDIVGSNKSHVKVFDGLYEYYLGNIVELFK